MPLHPEPLYTAPEIHERVQELAQEIQEAYSDTPPLCLITLKGALHFGSDLTRAMAFSTETEFIRARSYADTASTGDVQLLYTPTAALRDCHVLLIEDILDTGRTASTLLAWLEGQGVASCQVVSLLDKPDRREVDISPDFTGFSIDDRFVVGYGMDYNERYRELPDIRIWEP